MEIEPEMIVALEEVPSAPLPPLFFALPPARPMIPSAPSRRSSRRWITTKAHGHDSTSIVAPLPSPIPASSHDALRVAPAPPVRATRSWITVGLLAIATGAAIALVMTKVTSRAPALAPPRPSTSTVVPSVSSVPSVPPAASASPRAALPAPAPAPASPETPAQRPPRHVARAILPPAKKPVPPAPATSKPGALADPKLATRTAKPPAASDAKATTGPARPKLAKAAMPAKHKTVAAVDPSSAPSK